MTIRSAAATSSKLLVPRRAPDLIARGHLLERLAGIDRCRLTTVVAGTGYGKSTLVADWAADRPVAWYTADRTDRDPRSLVAGLTMAVRLRAPGLAPDPAVLAGGSPADDSHADGLAAFLAASLSDQLRVDTALVIDDAHELDGSPSAALLAALCRHAPPTLHLVLLSQHGAPFPIARLRAQSHVLEISGTDLAFSLSETVAVVSAVMQTPDAPQMAIAVQEVTAGWPAAVRMAAAALQGRPVEHRQAALDRLSRPGSPLAELLAQEVFAALGADDIAMLCAAAQFDRFSIELLEAMGVAGAAALPRLARGAVVVHDEAEPGWYSVPPLVRTYVLEHLTTADDPIVVDVARGAAWLERRGAHRDALALLVAAGDRAAVADYVVRSGRALVAAGGAADVLRAIDTLPAAERPTVIASEIEARFATGDWDTVAAAVDRFPPGALPPIVALRAGLVLHLRGRIRDALDTYTRGIGDVDSDGAIVASVVAYRSAARWLLGDADDCRADAAMAMSLALESGDESALAAAHTVAAMIAATAGDRAANQAHYMRALAHAEAAGDVLQIIRIRTNRGSRAIEEGAYGEGLVELDLAVDLAERSGYQSFAALALSNRGEAHLKLGRVDEAARDLADAVARYVVLGSRLRAYPLVHLGDLHRLRGERGQARVAFDEALRLAEEATDVQGLVPCLAGLAELLLVDDPDAAVGYAERALAIDPSLNRARALWAAGLLAARHNDGGGVGAHVGAHVGRLADDLAAIGSERRDRAATAWSLELRATVSAPDVARQRLSEAVDIWSAMGEPAGEARAMIALAGLSEAPVAIGLLDAAMAIVQRLGARSLVDTIDDARRRLDCVETAAVRVVTLGGLRVFRSGEAIPPTAWQSRKARDLLKLLASRLGRPVPREQVCEILWPDEPPARRSSRLSVTLSTLRGVLDPGREHDADAFVAADRENVWLQVGAVDLDVALFLDAAQRALADPSAPVTTLAAAETRYAGEFLEDDPYAAWAVGLREEARAVYLRIAQRLAERLDAAGDLDRSGHLYLRLLRRDPYDEAAHLALVRVLDRAAHRGEARRAYRTYTARMAELDVEPASYPT